MKTEFTRRARADLLSIKSFLSERDPAAGVQVLRRLRAAIERLETFPELGAPWRDGPTRALVVAGVPYRIHYLVRDDAIIVLTVMHTRRLPPEFQDI